DPRGDCFAAGGDAECATTCDGTGACALPTSPCGERCVDLPARLTPAMQSRNSEVQRYGCSLARRCEILIETTSCTFAACAGPTLGCSQQCSDEWQCTKGFSCFELSATDHQCIDMSNPT